LPPSRNRATRGSGQAQFGGERVRADDAVELMNQLLWSAFWTTLPLLAACLIVGVLISILQVATQLQDMTLSYVPKLFVAVIVLVALGPWMIHRITQFAIYVIKLIPSLS
jgi:flagellar biosynthetic protein FliQ